MEKFYAGIKGSVEILKPEEGTFLNKHNDMVERSNERAEKKTEQNNTDNM